jgi:hypothetical protein
VYVCDTIKIRVQLRGSNELARHRLIHEHRFKKVGELRKVHAVARRYRHRLSIAEIHKFSKGEYRFSSLMKQKKKGKITLFFASPDFFF